MDIDYIPLISFILITTFTPEPNNISSNSMGLMYGYRKTLGYLSGIATGFFIIMLVCAYLSSTLLLIMPGIENILRWVGASYILWLSYLTLKTNYTFDETRQPPMAYKKGLLLQLLNPKVVIYGLTLYSTFLSSISNQPVYLVLLAVLFASIAFCATSVWTLFGAFIKRYLKNNTLRKVLNTILAILLVYTAVEIYGVLSKFI